MNATSETYYHAHNILELADTFPHVSFKTSETERDYY